MARTSRATLASGVIACASFFASAADAQPSSEELAAGRQLFTEALDDEDHKRFAAAIEKYKRVLQIRDTPSIRYRLGVTCEGLGKTTQAIDAYGAAIRLAAVMGPDAKTEAGIARASQARIDALEPKVAHLSLRTPPPTSTAKIEVRVDDELVPVETRGDVRVDPGAHVVTATAEGSKPFRAEVALPEGGRAELPVLLEPLAPTAPAPAPPETSTSSLRTVGVVTGAAGAVFLVGGVVALVMRANAIGELEESCPRGDCPASRERELRDTHDRALVLGPAGGVLLGVGAVALGAGVVLYTLGGNEPARRGRSTPVTTARLASSPMSHGGMLTFTIEAP